MTLRTRYKVKELDDDKTERKARNRRRQRKHETAYEYGEIKDRAVAIVESLGQDGMSSDESDHEGHRGEATYYILEKDWRSKQVTLGYECWIPSTCASDTMNAFVREQLQATNQSDTRNTIAACENRREIQSFRPSGRPRTHVLLNGTWWYKLRLLRRCQRTSCPSANTFS
ncbi:hypothetical protein BKA82DRAFT_4019319 [Pisolithus tinctorius]|nr:hypothetical protein BKA82DRAFT_4022409 [Pisolithus tinctorius]KAI6140511.1 hypothetical protein BKA82DRAFT_4019319 [Pisolithus tinctorius]